MAARQVCQCTGEIKIYDILGKEITTLTNEFQKPGKYSIPFHTTELASGIYFYKVESDNFMETKKMLLLR